jgi:hypothetical protein
MVQELIDLRQSIVEGRYQDALDIIDELEGMKANGLNIQVLSKAITR